MKVLLAILAVVFAIMFVAPASEAIDLPKLDGFTSMVETIQAKRPKQSKSRKTKQDQCMAQCLQDCWFNCQAGCRCICYGLPKGCIGGPG